MGTNNKTKMLTINAMLLAIGAILHQITPAMGLPMQPDFALVMMIIIIVINKKDYKSILVSAIITGVFTAMTTKFPGGQLPNIADKLITSQLVYILICVLDKIKVFNKGKQNYFITTIVLPIGTLISGVVFLLSAQAIVGLPAPFIILFSTIVVPTVAINTVSGLALHKVINLAFKRSRSYN
ncbi:tryptophan transporter [Clostridium frigidicarnis]|uniref:Tryptophan transporter TrpP n=1 Tax=Clostridium frigidicarnis TaxID=84698 RepID=A0A1I1AVN5_9CLOT|nr:tryptophan transporter [Clostridium frigidicarnis]SFB41602.1 Tryptophan transporter TrpP [Clostridium frigidicarnis]